MRQKLVHPRQRIDVAAIPAACVILNHLHWIENQTEFNAISENTGDGVRLLSREKFLI